MEYKTNQFRFTGIASFIPDVFDSTTAAPMSAAEAVPAIGSRDRPLPPKPSKKCDQHISLDGGQCSKIERGHHRNAKRR